MKAGQKTRKSFLCKSSYHWKLSNESTMWHCRSCMTLDVVWKALACASVWGLAWESRCLFDAGCRPSLLAALLTQGTQLDWLYLEDLSTMAPSSVLVLPCQSSTWGCATYFMSRMWGGVLFVTSPTHLLPFPLLSSLSAASFFLLPFVLAPTLAFSDPCLQYGY